MKQQHGFIVGQLYRAEFHYSDVRAAMNASQYFASLQEEYSGICLYAGSEYEGSTHYFYVNGKRKAIDRGLLRCFKPWRHNDEV